MLKKLILSILISLLFVAKIYAEEKITNFHVEVKILPNGDFDVVEKITVIAEGDKIKRGIFRDFPTLYKLDQYTTFKSTCQLIEVLKDSIVENYKTVEHNNYVRIYIGNADAILLPGTYTYTIHYIVDKQMRFFDDYDEFYWNITGNYWDFPIEKASLTLYLPEGAKPINIVGYTGEKGAKDKNYQIVEEQNNEITLSTTQSLYMHEGFTVAISFPKGFVKKSEYLPAVYVEENNQRFTIGGGILILLLIFYTISWLTVGIDPQKGVIIPLYNIPEKYSPAKIGYVNEMAFSNKLLTASLLDLAIHKFIHIEEKKGKAKNAKTIYVITKLKELQRNNLSEESGEVFDNLFEENDVIFIEKSYNSDLYSAAYSLKHDLEEYEKENYFRLNTLFLKIGIAISFLGIIGVGYLSISLEHFEIFRIYVVSLITIGVASLIAWFITKDARFFIFLPTSFVSFIVSSFFVVNFRFLLLGAIIGAFLALLFYHITKKSLNKQTFRKWIIVKIILIATWLAISIAYYFTKDYISVELYFLLGLGIGIIHGFFANLLKAPTKEGQELLDKIAGFEMFVNVGEAERLKILDTPTMNIEVFEKYLPYAIALGLEQKWLSVFENVLAKSMNEPTEGHLYSANSWYISNNFNSINDFTDSISDLSSHISVSSNSLNSGGGYSSASGSSSDWSSSGSSSSDSGSSGDGGGGGGGGGW